MSRVSMRSRCALDRLLPVKWCLAATLGAIWLLACGAGASAENGPPHQSAASRGPSHLVVVRLTADGLRPLLAQRIEVELDVDEEILDTQVTGRAHVVGKPDVQFVASEERATLHLLLHGTAVSRTVGEKGAAVVRGRSRTAFTATRPIIFEPGKGFRGLQTVVSAETQFVTDGVGTAQSMESETGTTRGVVGRVIQRRAARRLEESRPQTAEIARGRAERRIREAVERRIDARLARLNWLIETKAQLIGEREPLLACCTTPECILIGFNGSSKWPDTPSGSADAPLGVWLHRSLFVSEKRTEAASMTDLGARSDQAQSPASAFELRRVLDGLLAIVAHQVGVAVRHHADWLVIEVGRGSSDEIHLAQTPAEIPLR